MSAIETIQSKLLAKHGYYNLAPLWSKYDKLCGKWCYQKKGVFHVIDSYLSEEERGRTLPFGFVLLSLREDGYHICNSSQKDKSSLYPIKDAKYFIVYDNNEYNELTYLHSSDIDEKFSFEFIETQNYLALLFHKFDLDKGIISTLIDRWENEIRLDCIVSKNKDILHEDVFTYFHERFIVVNDGVTTYVYDSNFNIKYKRDDYLRIWECRENVYLLFLHDKVVYELINEKEIKLSLQNSCDWYHAWAYQNYVILYGLNYYSVESRSSYYDDDDDWGYDEEPFDAPVRNTSGHIFDSSFNLLREFNTLGEIVEIKEIGNSIVMKTTSITTNTNDVDAYYNIKLPNITQYNSKTNEHFSVPDISFRLLECPDRLEELYVVKTRVASSDNINLGKDTNEDFCSEKCGVYCKTRSGKDEYEKIIECKYDYILGMSLRNDDNIYYAGINGKGDYGKFDLYVNHEILLSELPFIKGGSSLKVVSNSQFIQFRDQKGNIGVIRDGSVVLKPLYKDITIYVKKHSSFISNNYNENLEYLFVVSNGESYGICSPKGNLVLPIEYSMIDIDDDLLVILEHNDGRTLEVGYYDEETETMKHEEAEMEDGVVKLCDDYVWDGCFRYLNEDEHSEWTDQELRDAADSTYEGYSRTYLGIED